MYIRWYFKGWDCMVWYEMVCGSDVCSWCMPSEVICTAGGIYSPAPPSLSPVGRAESSLLISPRKLCHLPWNVSPSSGPSCKYSWIDFWNFPCQLYKQLPLILPDRHTRVLWPLLLVSFQSPTHQRSTLVFCRRGTALGGEARSIIVTLIMIPNSQLLKQKQNSQPKN